MAIQQDDILPMSVSYTTQVGVYRIGTSAEVQGNVSATGGSLAYSTSYYNRPLQLKIDNTSTTTFWDDVQNWTLNNVQFTTTIPVSVMSGGNVVASIATVSVTTGTLVGIFGPGAWSVSGNLTVSKRAGFGAGSLYAALYGAGNNGNALSTTDVFNGSTWQSAGSLLTIACFSVAGGGSQNAGIVFAGVDQSVNYLSNTQLFNGVTWSNGNNMTQSRAVLAGGGSQVAAWAVGGNNGNYLSLSELFNGSTWSTSANANFTRWTLVGCGTQNSALITCGTAGGTSTNTEIFNGTVWNYAPFTNRIRTTGFGSGNPNSAIIGGDDTNYTTITEIFNGSTWLSAGNVSISRGGNSSGGTQATAWMTGGLHGGTRFNTTEQHLQTLYSKITYENLLTAKSIGVAYNIVSNTCNVKFYGYLDNISISSNNNNITADSQWVGGYWTLGVNASNTQTTAEPNFTFVRSQSLVEDFKIGFNISRTQMQVVTDHNLTHDIIGKW